MIGEQKPGGLEVVGWVKRTNESHPIGLTQPSDWRFSPHEPVLSEGSKPEWFDQFRVTPAEPAEARIRSLEAKLARAVEAATYAVGLLPGLAGATDKPDNAVYSIMAAKCEILKARALLAALQQEGE